MSYNEEEDKKHREQHAPIEQPIKRDELRHSPTQTEADKQREFLTQLVISNSVGAVKSTTVATLIVNALIHSGVRVLQPNEFVARELTDDQVTMLKNAWFSDAIRSPESFINAVISETKKVQP